MSRSTQQHVKRLLAAAASGDRKAADQLLPVVYDDLRRFAAALLARESNLGSGTLQPTLLVHEAYLRLVGPGGKGDDGSSAAGGGAAGWEGRRHFFGAAARAMRQILIDRARHLHAAGMPRAQNLDPTQIPDPATAGLPTDPDQLLALDGALDSLASRDGRQHEVVMLRYFAGLTIEETAQALGISAGTVKSDWTYARAWLLRELERQSPPGAPP